MRPPESAVDRIGSSGNRDCARRLSENVAGPPRGGFAPFTLTSRDLSEFSEKRALLGAEVVAVEAKYAMARTRRAKKVRGRKKRGGEKSAGAEKAGAGKAPSARFA